MAGGDARVLAVIGAAGDFWAGAHLTVQPQARPPMANMAEVNQASLGLHRLPIPIIARVDGVAVGAWINLGAGVYLLHRAHPGPPLRHLGLAAALGSLLDRVLEWCRRG